MLMMRMLVVVVVLWIDTLPARSLVPSWFRPAFRTVKVVPCTIPCILIILLLIIYITVIVIVITISSIIVIMVTCGPI